MKKLLMMVCILGIMTAGSALAVVVEDDLAEGLVSAWLFDEGSGGTAYDSGGANNGIIHGATWTAGKFGGALAFNGTDAYVEVPDSPSLHLPEGLTVAAWMFVNTLGNHAAIIWKGEMIGWGANFSFRAATSTAGMTWGRCKDGGEEYFATDGVINTGEWTHMAMVSRAQADADGNHMSAYINGEDITGVTGQGGNIVEPPPYLVFEGEPVEIGVGRGIGGTVGNDTYFDGIIDEVVIYNRALTPGELRRIADFGAASVAVEPAGKLATTWSELKK